MDITKNKNVSFSKSSYRRDQEPPRGCSYIEYENEYDEPTITDILTYIQTYPLSLNDNNIKKTLLYAIEKETTKYKHYKPLHSIIL